MTRDILIALAVVGGTAFAAPQSIRFMDAGLDTNNAPTFRYDGKTLDCNGVRHLFSEAEQSHLSISVRVSGNRDFAKVIAETTKCSGKAKIGFLVEPRDLSGTP